MSKSQPCVKCFCRLQRKSGCLNTTPNELYTNRVHTWNANKGRGLFSLVLHTNEQGGRNNRNQPCLCSPTASYCPALSLFTYISTAEYNKDTYCLHSITLQLCNTMTHKALCTSLLRGKWKHQKTDKTCSKEKFKPSISLRHNDSPYFVYKTVFIWTLNAFHNEGGKHSHVKQKNEWPAAEALPSIF